MSKTVKLKLKRDTNLLLGLSIDAAKKLIQEWHGDTIEAVPCSEDRFSTEKCFADSIRLLVEDDIVVKAQYG